MISPDAPSNTRSRVALLKKLSMVTETNILSLSQYLRLSPIATSEAIAKSLPYISPKTYDSTPLLRFPGNDRVAEGMRA